MVSVTENDPNTYKRKNINVYFILRIHVISPNVFMG